MILQKGCLLFFFAKHRLVPFHLLLQQQQQPPHQTNKLSILVHSFLNIFIFPTMTLACKWLAIPSNLSITPLLSRKATGTLFYSHRGHISFVVQLDLCAEPLLLVELAMSTTSFIKEMSSGLVCIALECDKLSATTGSSSRSPFRPCIPTTGSVGTGYDACARTATGTCRACRSVPA